MSENRAQPLESPVERSRLASVLNEVSRAVETDKFHIRLFFEKNNPGEKVELTGLETTPDGVFFNKDNKFEAVANAYFIVYYSTSATSAISESVPAHVTGHFDADNTAVIDHIVVQDEATGEDLQ